MEIMVVLATLKFKAQVRERKKTRIDFLLSVMVHYFDLM